MIDILSRRPDESDIEYHRRLVYGKLIDRTMSDVDYSELSIPVYGTSYNSDTTRKAMYGSLKTLQLLDKNKEAEAVSADGVGIIDEIEKKKMELQKERQRMFDQRNALNKMLRERARSEELNEIITDAVRDGNLPSLQYVANDIRESDNDLLVSLNDIHYGAVVDNYWCHYDPDVCAKMMREYLDQIKRVAETHGSENCIVWANGDMISGNIHYEIAVNNRENLVRQVMGVSELIANFLAELSGMFSKVMFVSVAGNHSRIGDKDMSIMDERLDDLIQWYLKARMAGFDNVDISFGDKIDTSMYVMNVRGLNYVGVHGDYDPSPANIQTLQQMVQRPVYAVLCGHLHHNSTNVIQGIKTVMAGSFLGMDGYCVQRRIYGKPQQMILVCNDRGIKCCYDVDFSNQ